MTPVRKVVLIGAMGAGKSTVGELLAARLGWTFVDLDRWIEEREGRPVHDIFESDGEAAFRRLEAEATERLAAEEELVLAPGGGWITGDGNLECLGPHALFVWLQVSAEVAVRRTATSGVRRPLLDVPDPSAAAARLLSEREALYARAELHISTLDQGPEAVARTIEDHLLTRGSAPPRIR